MAPASPGAVRGSWWHLLMSLSSLLSHSGAAGLRQGTWGAGLAHPSLRKRGEHPQIQHLAPLASTGTGNGDSHGDGDKDMFGDLHRNGEEDLHGYGEWEPPWELRYPWGWAWGPPRGSPWAWGQEHPWGWRPILELGWGPPWNQEHLWGWTWGHPWGWRPPGCVWGPPWGWGQGKEMRTSPSLGTGGRAPVPLHSPISVSGHSGTSCRMSSMTP